MQQKISYWIDEGDIIRQVDDFWDQSLEDPTAARVKSSEIIGKSLFNFICDDITRMFIRTLLQSARLMMKPLSRPYRCDSPHEKRYMQMTITPEQEGLVSVTHEIIKTEPLVKPALFKTLPSSFSTFQSAVHIRCSICNRVRLMGTENWHEINALPESITSTTEQPMQVIYGVCRDCISSLKNRTHHYATF